MADAKTFKASLDSSIRPKASLATLRNKLIDKSGCMHSSELIAVKDAHNKEQRNISFLRNLVASNHDWLWSLLLSSTWDDKSPDRLRNSPSESRLTEVRQVRSQD